MHCSHSRPRWTVVFGTEPSKAVWEQMLCPCITQSGVDFRWSDKWKSCSLSDLAGPLGILLTLVPSPSEVLPLPSAVVRAFCDGTRTIPASLSFSELVPCPLILAMPSGNPNAAVRS